jgi:hypothetical protein
MKFTLDFNLDAGDSTPDSASFLAALDKHRGAISDISALEGRITVVLDGKDLCGDYSDPIVRLIDQWLRKLPWIIGGDTETVALRNSEHCFAFVPASESVELSYFQGSETEIEEYVLDPVTIRLDTFVSETIRLGDRLVEIIKRFDAGLLDRHEDCKDLQTSLSEAKRAWREHQLHQRR